MLSTKLKEAAGNSADATLYVDDVFSTYLYIGNGTTQTITNGIDLAGKGGMVWIKDRTSANPHQLIDTSRGGSSSLASNSNTAPTTGTYITSFNSNGFSLSNYAYINASSDNFASWTFRKAAKFFDVVTYTGDGVAGRQIAHNLGIAPGMIIVKRTDTTGNWRVYSNGLTSATYFVSLDLTDAQASGSSIWDSTAPTSSVFSVGVNASVNASGGTYVAYLFAHDTSSTGIIQCGSVTVDGSGNANVNLGWQPQFAMYKMTSTVDDWKTLDTMRGFTASNGSNTNPYALLRPNTADAEGNFTGQWQVTSTGLQLTQPGNAGQTYIYMAIRMPNKPPTTGTQVFSPVAVNSSASTQSVDAGFPVDLVIKDYRNLVNGAMWFDRLRGITSSSNPRLISASTNAEVNTNDINGAYQTGVTEVGIGTGYTSIDWFFKRAPGFFDEVCYTGTGVATTQAHNLGVAPELIIFKDRTNSVTDWFVPYSFSSNFKYLYLNQTNASGTISYGSGQVLSAAPTSTLLNLGSDGTANRVSSNFVAYLFATLAGISKVGSYTGNGTGQAIACGFGAAGARFVLIKRTDSTGDWYTFDSARGLTSGSSPYLLLNSTAAEVTGNNGVYASTGGFTLGATAITTTNILGASYIYLSVA